MLDVITSTFREALGLGLESGEINAWQMSARAVVVFAVSTLMLRIGNQRFLGRSTAMDAMLGIVYGSVVSRAITGQAPFGPALAAGLTLVLAHWVLSAVAFRSHGFGCMVKGRAHRLVQDGTIDWDAMRTHQITERDLHEALRTHGHVPETERIALAHLERNGDISLVMKS